MSWKEKQLSELCDSIVDCRNKTAPESECITPYKMLRTSNIRNGTIDYDNVKYVDEFKELQKNARAEKMGIWE